MYADTARTIRHGDLLTASQSVDRALKQYSSKSPEWSARFRVLKAQILVSQLACTDAIAILQSDLPPSLATADTAVLRLLYLGVAYRICQDFKESASALHAAEQAATKFQPQLLAAVLNAEGGLEVDEGRLDEAQTSFEGALTLAHQRDNRDLEANIFVAQARLSTSRRRFDEAVDLSEKSLKLSLSLDLKSLVATNLGNSAWSYYELGDFDGAQDNYQKAADASQRAGLKGYQLYWLTGVANSYSAKHDYASAEKLLQSTLRLARDLGNKQTIVECLNDLTDVMLRTNDVERAQGYIAEAKEWERQGEQLGVLQSRLLSAQIAERKGDHGQAEDLFQAVLGDQKADTPLHWQAQAGLAGAREDQGKPAEAEGLYKAAIATIETARGSVEHEDLRLSFLSSGIAVYGDYIDFLIRHGRAEDALFQADLSRARTLAEGLSASPTAKPPLAPRNTTVQAVPLRPQQLAQHLRATLLIYWLGERQSYLWAVTPTKTECFKLPPAAEIDALLKTYRDATLKSADLLATSSDTGQKLYATLVAPPVGAALSGRPGRAKSPASTPASRFIIFPDGSLNGLNFETLIVPQPAPHFWIEDATITTGNSLSMLSAAAHRPPAPQRNVLLIGDAIPLPEFGDLPQARVELQKIGQRFPGKRQTVLQRDQATRDAYLASHPERYAYLHFVTHGTASRARPLESAVILSKEPGTDIYKLYARDIVAHPLKAELVTISACNGSGTRAYSGEGLVGLSWAFLRAGAHNVIGALWEVSDVSTPQLMDKLYAELASGKDPATALRSAKLSLLHQKNVFAKPFYWAPFQLYAGS